jgi:hypothetical protein
MRLKISEAARRLEDDANDPDGEWAREIRLAVTRDCPSSAGPSC